MKKHLKFFPFNNLSIEFIRKNLIFSNAKQHWPEKQLAFALNKMKKYYI
jgi:hypothetical protein